MVEKKERRWGKITDEQPVYDRKKSCDPKSKVKCIISYHISRIPKPGSIEVMDKKW